MKIETVSRESLIDALKEAKSYRDVFKYFSTYDDGPNYRRLKTRLKELNLEVPFSETNKKETFCNAVNSVTSMTELIEYLGLSKSPNNYSRFKKKIESLNLDTTHWKRKRKRKSERQNCLSRDIKYSLSSILVKNSEYKNSSNLRKRLIKEGLLKNRCAWDDCPTRSMKNWRGKAITFELDHINGDKTDNRLINLRILCRICHGQTPTHSIKKSSKY
jgi:hypothetical protein